IGISTKICHGWLRNLNTTNVLTNAHRNVTAKIGLRPYRCASFVKTSIPANDPRFCRIILNPVHIRRRAGTSVGGTFCDFKILVVTSPTSSGLKKPTPQSPTTPAMQRSIPSNAGRRQRPSPNSERYEPNRTLVRRPSARARTHFSGSFKRTWRNTHRKAGNAPTQKRYFQKSHEGFPPACTAATWLQPIP